MTTKVATKINQRAMKDERHDDGPAEPQRAQKQDGSLQPNCRERVGERIPSHRETRLAQFRNARRQRPKTQGRIPPSQIGEQNSPRKYELRRYISQSQHARTGAAERGRQRGHDDAKARNAIDNNAARVLAVGAVNLSESAFRCLHGLHYPQREQGQGRFGRIQRTNGDKRRGELGTASKAAITTINRPISA